ncbi:MAG TPA: AAA family ATPase [Methanothrix sp.]|nr:AAA family ATPase [Methanothrix sp.]HOL44494.1 AAA family ATPase [Methanothrix sp.]
MILIEKYRPGALSEIVGLGPIGFEIGQDLPHLLLYGPPGTGKTSFAKCVINMLEAETLVLNASKDRGIDVIRSQVSDFAMMQSFNGRIRIVFLDEADALTADAQNSLRNLMETYAENCRFILTANYINKIIEPIRSRCVTIEFGNMKKEDVVRRLQYICESEGIPYEIEALERIADVCGSDIRSAVNRIEALRDGVWANRVDAKWFVAKEVFEKLRDGDFQGARTAYLNSRMHEETLLLDLYEVVWRSDESLQMKAELIHQIADGLRYVKNVAWKQIEIEDRLLSMMEVLTRSKTSKS